MQLQLRGENRRRLVTGWVWTAGTGRASSSPISKASAFERPSQDGLWVKLITREMMSHPDKSMSTKFCISSCVLWCFCISSYMLLTKFFPFFQFEY